MNAKLGTMAIPTDRKWFWVALALFAFAVVVALLRITTLSEFLGVRLSMPLAMNDFKSAIYCPVSAFLHGGNPYNREEFLRFCPIVDVFPLYLPATLVLHAPLGLLPIEVATPIYFSITVCLTLLTAFLAFRLNGLEPSPTNVLLTSGILLISRPGQWNLLMGQPALEMLIATYLALHFSRRAPALSGVALAVAFCKPSFGIPLAVLMLARRDTRAVMMGIAFAAILNLPPLVVLFHRAGGMESFVQGILESQRAWQTAVDPSTQVYGVDAPGLLSRLLGHRLGGGAYLVVTSAVLGTAMIAVRRLPWPGGEATAHLSNSIICLAILLSLHHHAYDLVLLTGPAVALAKGRLPSAVTIPRVRRTLLALFAILAGNYVTTYSVLHRIEDHRLVWILLGSINGFVLLTIYFLYLRHGSVRSAAGEVAPSAAAT